MPSWHSLLPPRGAGQASSYVLFLFSPTFRLVTARPRSRRILNGCQEVSSSSYLFATFPSSPSPCSRRCEMKRRQGPIEESHAEVQACVSGWGSEKEKMEADGRALPSSQHVKSNVDGSGRRTLEAFSEGRSYSVESIVFEEEDARLIVSKQRRSQEQRKADTQRQSKAESVVEPSTINSSAQTPARPRSSLLHKRPQSRIIRLPPVMILHLGPSFFPPLVQK